jgi:hypothetical protein
MREIARDLVLSKSCLRRWADLADVDGGPREGLTSDERRELVKVLVKIAAKRPDGTARTILGVHMVGPWVTEQLGQGYLALNWEATVEKSLTSSAAPDVVRAVRRERAGDDRTEPARLTADIALLVVGRVSQTELPCIERDDSYASLPTQLHPCSRDPEYPC